MSDSNLQAIRFADSTFYKWEEVAKMGNGSFQEEWRPGTFPLGLLPIPAFNNNLWMIGQKAVWESVDGINWNRFEKIDWGERISMAYIYFDDKLWMFGGMELPKTFKNDMWYSPDGTNWQKAKNALWQPRKGHTIISFKNKLWLFGGATDILSDGSPDKFLNDVWNSEDGVNWKEVLNSRWTPITRSSPWIPRDHPRVVVFNDSLFMLGGQGQADIWKSADGINWTQLTTEAEWKNRYDYGAIVFDNKMWIYGGREEISTNAYNDVWYSTNGKHWYMQTQNAPWTKRSGVHSTVFKNKLWIYSGKHTGAPDNWGGDIWTMEKTNDK